MTSFTALPRGTSLLATRLGRLTPLTLEEGEAILLAERDQRLWPARRELVAEGERMKGPRALLSGWACRQRILSDGRRQILSFLLPGDLIGMCRHSDPIASTTILAITEVVTCAAPAAEPHTSLSEAYARSAAMEEHYLLAQITRLGRLSSYERLADWILETADRLALVDLSTAAHFPMPLTQEMLADALGLTSVHVNRTVQAMRRDGLVSLQKGVISLPGRAQLAKLVGYNAPRVSVS